jgi:hypothetical protein
VWIFSKRGVLREIRKPGCQPVAVVVFILIVIAVLKTFLFP